MNSAFLIAFLSGICATSVSALFMLVVMVRLNRRAQTRARAMRKSAQTSNNANLQQTSTSSHDYRIEGWIKLKNSFDPESTADEAIPLSMARLLHQGGITRTQISDLPSSYYYGTIEGGRLLLYYDQEDAERGKLPVTNIQLDGGNVTFVPGGLLFYEKFSKNFPLHIETKRFQHHYIFFCTSSEKENWYIRLLHEVGGINLETVDRRLGVYSSSSEGKLGILHSLPGDSLWFSALIHRVFAIDNIRDMFHTVLTERLERMAAASFLQNVRISHVDVSSMPRFSNFRILSCDHISGLCVDFTVDFAGEVRVRLESDLVLNALVTSITIPIGLEVCLTSLSARAQALMKPKPSNRIWMGFHAPGPKYTVEITPSVSTQSVRLSLITELLESQLESLIQESVVLPNMDEWPIDESSLLDCPFSSGFCSLSGSTTNSNSNLIRKNTVTSSLTRLNSTTGAILERLQTDLLGLQAVPELKKRNT